MKRIGHTLAVAAGALTLVGVSATTAYASVSATLTSLNPAGAGSNVPDVTLSVPALDFTCDTALGLATLGSSPASTTPSGTWDYAWFQGCYGPAGIQLTGTSAGSWTITDITGGDGEVTDIDVHFSGNNPSCSFDLRGYVDTHFTLASPSRLEITSSTLHLENVSGCASLIAENDPAILEATFAVS